MRRIVALSLLTPALLAQAPVTPAPQTLAQKVAVETKAIEALKREDPLAALEKAKALLPASRLPFDKTNLQTTFPSIREWNAHLDIYRLIYNTAIAAGHYEEAKQACEQGRDLAKELQLKALDSFSDFKAIWSKAGADSTKLLDEIKELEAKVEANRAAMAAPPAAKQSVEDANAEIMRQHDISQRLAFLKANEATYKQNVETSTKVMEPLERPIKDLEARTHEFDGPLAQWEKYLKEEAESLATTYKGDKTKFAAGLLNAVGAKPENRESALVTLYRAAFLDPQNQAIQKRMDQLLGKIPAQVARPTKAKGKKRRA